MAISLDVYPARKCPRVTHNMFSPDAPQPQAPSAELQMLIDDATAFRRQVIDELIACQPRHAIVHVDDADREAALARTSLAIADQVPLIVGARLTPVDGRSGAPDVLLFAGDGYVPIVIKAHRTLTKPSTAAKPKGKALVSSLTAPAKEVEIIGRTNKGGSWADDCFQLAHYWRVLEGLGIGSPSTPRGGIIGTSDLSAELGAPRGVTWYRLDEPHQQTYSSSAPGHRAKRTSLERYDHEFEFRRKVAEVAWQGGELVRPIGVDACTQCPWHDHCRSVVPEDDASFAIEAGRLKAREWLYLADGRDRFSVSELASLDVEATLAGFVEHAVGTTNPEQRLRNVVRRAQMTVAGRDFEPLGEGWPEVPQAGLEVDYDLEWDLNNRIYLWGIRTRRDQDDSTATYEPVVSFEPLDDDAELALAHEFAQRITDLAKQAESEGRTFEIYHWSHPERSRTRHVDAVRAALEGRTRDLLVDWFRPHVFARRSSSIKHVAQSLGYQWRVEDPGGRASQLLVDVARGSGPDADEARTWCLDYNHSDVEAQAFIRDQFRAIALEDG